MGFFDSEHNKSSRAASSKLFLSWHTALNAMQVGFNFPRATKWDRSNYIVLPYFYYYDYYASLGSRIRWKDVATERRSSRAKKSYKSNPKAFRFITIIIIIQNSSHLMAVVRINTIISRRKRNRNEQEKAYINNKIQFSFIEIIYFSSTISKDHELNVASKEEEEGDKIKWVSR